MKILRTWWFGGNIGIVAGEDDLTKDRKAYIGIMPGFDEAQDARSISQMGSPVSPAILTEIVSYLKGE